MILQGCVFYFGMLIQQSLQMEKFSERVMMLQQRMITSGGK